METLGQKISAARKKRGARLVDLSELVGLSVSQLSDIENDQTKRPVDPRHLIRISDALSAPGILLHHCQTCPIRQHVFLKYFPDLNRINSEPAVIAARLRKEMVEAVEALDRLGEKFSNRNFRDQPDYMQMFEREMEQVVDVKRGIEILEFELLLGGVHTQEDFQRVYDNQQRKCEEHGHHMVEEDRRGGGDRRTGTEG